MEEMLNAILNSLGGGGVKESLDCLSQRQDSVEQSLEGLSQRQETMEQKQETMQQGFDRLEKTRIFLLANCRHSAPGWKELKTDLIGLKSNLMEFRKSWITSL
ncbi:hypothetical protein [Lentibacillus salicampi]|uniref:Uncharacterized protein n=1 Tax=Lentibacillus salicampi TaxID=175306 RepID=A0A4Y9A7W1_9BACI|nr:hypothetical protein [Lentibacillus salicampi]TFJ91869.1 hypothetical protein E4U82_15580 [Lentibacillus salicampi]